MNYINEQITKTFEYLLNLHSKYHSINKLILSPKKTKIFYRINHEKLEKYRNENQKKTIIKVLSNKIIHQKTISTQTTFTHSSLNTLSTSSFTETNEFTDTSFSSSNTTTTTTNSNGRIYIRHMLSDD